MAASKYTAGGGGARGDMRGYNFGPVAGTTTYGGSGVRQLPWAPPGMPISRQGDPGFFDFAGKLIKGAVGVVSKLGIPGISGAAGFVGGLLGGGARGPGISGPLPQLPGRPLGALPTSFREKAAAFFPGGETGMGMGCGQGYRPNKSGYYVQGAGGGQGQYIEPNTVCVKRRRMNPLNPRALSKAMRRIESAKRATTVLNRITIRKKC